jgi:hypothetical protein
MTRLLTLTAALALVLPCSLGCAKADKPAKKKPAAEKTDDGKAGEKKDGAVPGTDPTTPVNPTNPAKPPGSGF